MSRLFPVAQVICGHCRFFSHGLMMIMTICPLMESLLKCPIAWSILFYNSYIRPECPVLITKEFANGYKRFDMAYIFYLVVTFFLRVTKINSTFCDNSSRIYLLLMILYRIVLQQYYTVHSTYIIWFIIYKDSRLFPKMLRIRSRRFIGFCSMYRNKFIEIFNP